MGEGQITTLIENVVYQSGLVAEHGFSAWIEWKGQSILFDFGQSPRFLSNAVVLGFNPTRIDLAVVSHGHYDHTGGIQEFLSKNTRASIWIREAALDPKASKTKNNIGIPSLEILDRSRFRHPEGLTEVAPGVFLLPPPPLIFPDDFHGDGLLVSRDGAWLSDDFSDEQSLVLVGDQSITLLSACSHRGMANILHSASEAFGLPSDLVVGGFHWKNLGFEECDRAVARLHQFPVRRFGVCHCTGVEHLGHLQTGLTAEVFYNHTGRRVFF